MRPSYLKRIIAGLAGLACTLFIVSCANTVLGRPIRKDSIQDVIVGRTTKEEVTKMFGEPYRTDNLGDREILSYKYITEKGDYQEFIVTVENDVVSTFSYK